jgi:hypothetical protein
MSPVCNFITHLRETEQENVCGSNSWEPSTGYPNRILIVGIPLTRLFVASQELKPNMFQNIAKFSRGKKQYLRRHVTVYNKVYQIAGYQKAAVEFSYRQFDSRCRENKVQMISNKMFQSCGQMCSANTRK